jgi:hypothetical protein
LSDFGVSRSVVGDVFCVGVVRACEQLDDAEEGGEGGVVETDAVVRDLMCCGADERGVDREEGCQWEEEGATEGDGRGGQYKDVEDKSCAQSEPAQWASVMEKT